MSARELTPSTPPFQSPTRRHFATLLGAVFGTLAIGGRVALAAPEPGKELADSWLRDLKKGFSDRTQWISDEEKRWSSEIQKRWVEDKHWLSEKEQRLATVLKDELRSDKQWLEKHDWWPKENFGWGKKSPSSTQCFLRGTRIQTVRGEQCIEELAKGDLVTTYKGAQVPIKSVHGRRASTRYANDFPVRVSRRAIDEESPNGDLYLSPGHAVYIDGMLIPVSELINGTTIVHALPNGMSDIEYFHVELDTHEIIFAHGMPVESLFVKCVGTRKDNFAVEPDVLRDPAMQPYAAVSGYNGGRAALRALLRRALYPVVDVRDPIQVVYDRIQLRAT